MTTPETEPSAPLAESEAPSGEDAPDRTQPPVGKQAATSPPPSTEQRRLVRALEPVLASHNRAVLAAATLGTILAVCALISAAALLSGSRFLALCLLGFAGVAVWQAVRFHRQAIYETGAARRETARVLDAILASGASVELSALTARFAPETCVLALDTLARLGVVYATCTEGVDRVHLLPDPRLDRLRAAREAAG